jgi:hypothetical protein
MMNMKKAVSLLTIVMIGNLAGAQYKPVDNGSSIHFTIKNFGIGTSGSFSGLQGDIKFDINDLADANFKMSIDANTINTGNETSKIILVFPSSLQKYPTRLKRANCSFLGSLPSGTKQKISHSRSQQPLTVMDIFLRARST